MEEIIEQPTFKTMYAKLQTIEAYTELNNRIGKAMKYPDEKSDTEFYADPNPSPINGEYFMEITADVQKRFMSVLNGIELVEFNPIQDDSN